MADRTWGVSQDSTHWLSLVRHPHMVVSLSRGDPNIDPQIRNSLLQGPRTGTSNFGEAPSIKVCRLSHSKALNRVFGQGA